MNITQELGAGETFKRICQPCQSPPPLWAVSSPTHSNELHFILALLHYGFHQRTLRFVIDHKDLALGIGCMGSVGALEVHFFRGESNLSSNAVLRGPELLPWLRLLYVAGRCGGWVVHLITALREVL